MSWPVLRLEQLAASEPASIKIGPFGSQLKKSELVTSGVHVIGIENVMAASFDGLGNRYITEKKFSSLSSVEIKPGDVLITMMGTIGEVCVVPPTILKSIMDSHLLRFRPNRTLCSPEYVLWLIKGSRAVREALDSRAHGAIMKGLNSNIIRSLPAPLPPLAEQERIVKLLNEADELRKLRDQADRRTAALIPALFHEMFGENGKRAHERVRLEQIAEVVSGVTKGRKFNGRRSVEVPYLRVANVQAGHLDLSEIKTIQALPEEVEKLVLRKGDVLLTEGGDFDKLGRGAMLEQDLPKCIHQNHVFRVRAEQSTLEPVYFAKFLLTPEAKGYFLGCAKRTTNLASISMKQLRALPVPLPPLALQKEFAKRMTEIRELEATQATSRRRLDGLFHSVLHSAFNGEL
jgi:type I restriction enzyme, S subunit